METAMVILILKRRRKEIIIECNLNMVLKIKNMQNIKNNIFEE